MQNNFPGQRGISEDYTFLLYLLIMAGTMYGLKYYLAYIDVVFYIRQMWTHSGFIIPVITSQKFYVFVSEKSDLSAGY